MKSKKSHLTPFAVIVFFLMLALACVPTQRTHYSKPVVYPCVHYAGLTYSPILLKINISSSYTMKDLSAVRQNDPAIIMEELHKLNYSYQIADGVTPNLVLNVTYNNDGFDHYGVTLYVNWQGQANFTITLPTNYVTGQKLIADMAAEFNRWVVNGWHSGNCN
jgi:hypothetical protein